MKHFSLETDPMLQCPCCGLYNLSSDTKIKLDALREFKGGPVRISSGCRCEKYNASLSGASPTSSHIATKDNPSHALDIPCVNSNKRYFLVEAAQLAGFHRILLYDTFIHIDNDPLKPKTILALM